MEQNCEGGFTFYVTHLHAHQTKDFFSHPRGNFYPLFWNEMIDTIPKVKVI